MPTPDSDCRTKLFAAPAATWTVDHVAWLALESENRYLRARVRELEDEVHRLRVDRLDVEGK